MMLLVQLANMLLQLVLLLVLLMQIAWKCLASWWKKKESCDNVLKPRSSASGFTATSVVSKVLLNLVINQEPAWQSWDNLMWRWHGITFKAQGGRVGDSLPWRHLMQRHLMSWQKQKRKVLKFISSVATVAGRSLVMIEQKICDTQ